MNKLPNIRVSESRYYRPLVIGDFMTLLFYIQFPQFVLK